MEPGEASLRCRVYGLGFRALGLGVGVGVLGVRGLGFRALGFGFRVWALGCEVWGVALAGFLRPLTSPRHPAQCASKKAGTLHDSRRGPQHDLPDKSRCTAVLPIICVSIHPW